MTDPNFQRVVLSPPAEIVTNHDSSSSTPGSVSKLVSRFYFRIFFCFCSIYDLENLRLIYCLYADPPEI